MILDIFEGAKTVDDVSVKRLLKDFEKNGYTVRDMSDGLIYVSKEGDDAVLNLKDYKKTKRIGYYKKGMFRWKYIFIGAGLAYIAYKLFFSRDSVVPEDNELRKARQVNKYNSSPLSMISSML